LIQTWRSPYLDIVTGLFVPQLISWDPESGEFTRVEGPNGFETWGEAEEASRFLARPVAV
jgi:hypothetical protein